MDGNVQESEKRRKIVIVCLKKVNKTPLPLCFSLFQRQLHPEKKRGVNDEEKKKLFQTVSKKRIDDDDDVYQEEDVTKQP